MVAISACFADREPQLLLLAEIAQEFGCRPSELLRGEASDLQIDLASAAVLWRERTKAVMSEA
jgi:integrase